MKQLRKWMALTVAILLFCAALPVRAAEGQTEYTDKNGIVYRIGNGTATLVDGTAAVGKIELPNEVEGCPLVAIGDYAFSNRVQEASITDLEIPETVVRIGEGSLGCRALKTVTFSDGASEEEPAARGGIPAGIGDLAFLGTRIKDITIPGRFRVLGNKLFSECRQIKRIAIEEGITEIGDNALSAESLEEVHLPESVVT